MVGTLWFQARRARSDAPCQGHAGAAVFAVSDRHFQLATWIPRISNLKSEISKQPGRAAGAGKGIAILLTLYCIVRILRVDL
jgi:hypothetical protein